LFALRARLLPELPQWDGQPDWRCGGIGTVIGAARGWTARQGGGLAGWRKIQITRWGRESA
jgi:hypothetical protein